jgi:hypothetical protein
MSLKIGKFHEEIPMDIYGGVWASDKIHTRGRHEIDCHFHRL